MVELVIENDVARVLERAAEEKVSGGWDALVLVAPAGATTSLPAVDQGLTRARAADASFDGAGGAHLVVTEGVPGTRLVFASVGDLTKEYDDVRRYRDAAAAAVRRARDAGAQRPLLVVAPMADRPDLAQAVAVSALGAMGGLWEPYEARVPGDGRPLDPPVEPVEKLGLASLAGPVSSELAAWVRAVERGRRLARDLGGTEPERMAPPAFARRCRDAFADTGIDVDVVDDLDVIVRDYPVLSAVARASFPVARHHPRIVRLRYRPAGEVRRTLFFAGKGVTYDTGGADLKVGGHMAGMSRDKGGAAAIAGMMLAIAELKPEGVEVVAELGVVRNSIGAEAFVADEIITGHSGVRVRIGNTDAEGRLVMADLLSHLREEARTAPSPTLFTCATLTGHAALAMGPYSLTVENRPARQQGIGVRLADAGERWGDPFETSRLRREDWDFIRPRSRADDVINCNNAPSSATARGHQFPAAFLLIASGLAAHGHRDAEVLLPFVHIDIGGSACEGGDWQHGRPTAAPVVALVAALFE
ncbi:MAG: leucyl aminopeptidase family protein [Myxococcota bacterium]